MARKLDIGAMLEGTVSKLNTMRVQDIPLSLIDEHEGNCYDQRGIDELAESIEVIGLQQPLVVVPEKDRYCLLAGHRRRNALALLGRETAPCRILDADLDPSLRVLILHWTNTMARGGAGLKGDAIAGAAKEIEAALTDLKQRGVLELPGKLRAYVAEVMKVSEGALARAQAVDKHLIKAFKGDHKCGRINDAVAYELSQCDDELQRELHALYKGNMWQLDAKGVKAHKKAAAAGFAPLQCPAEKSGVEPCVGTDKRAAAVKRGECPGCCHDCDKADGCEWVCGVVKQRIAAEHSAEERQSAREKRIADYEASDVGAVRRHIREVAEECGITDAAGLSKIGLYYNSWLWSNDPTCGSELRLETLQQLADHIGISLQELLFGNPEGAPLRQLDEQMRQAVQEAPAPVWHPYPDERPEEGQKVLTLCHSKYNRDNYAAYIYRAGNWYLPEMPDDGLMTVDVSWWSAELPPEVD